MAKRNAVTIKGPDIPPALAHLAIKEALFCLEYLKDFNGTRAVIAAGYDSKAPAGFAYELLRKPQIASILGDMAYERARALDVDGRRILAELAAIAFSPIGTQGITAADKTRALNLLGVHHKLWEGSKGDRTIVINMTSLDLRTM